MADDANSSRSQPANESRLGDLLAVGEASLRKLAESARQLQDALGGGSSGSPKTAPTRTGSAQDALAKLKNGIYQMRNLFTEARAAGGVPEAHLNNAQKCLNSTTGCLRGLATKGYPAAKEVVSNALERSEAYVKAQPYKGLLACLGLGLLLGVLIGR